MGAGTVFAVFLGFRRRQANEQINIVRLYGCFACCAVTADFPALFAAVNDDVPLSRIRLYPNRAQDATAGVLPVTGQNVHM